MNTKLLEDILSCPSLPSLPAVALRVIELTGDEDVSMDELAATIQNDQALSSKVLRTVNSSFYGLRQKCGTIRKAIGMLGLGPVKSLTLGFSLVSSFEKNKAEGFDYESYWRRGLYCSVAAQRFALAVKHEDPDEVFLAGLLQDIGIMAIFQVVKQDYATLIGEAGGDHRILSRLEVERLELTHADIGSMLCKRWRLPDELVLPVKFHERPTAAPMTVRDTTRLLGIGNLVHDLLTLEDTTAVLKELYRRGEEWFGLTGEQVDEIIAAVGEDTKQMASLFQLSIGDQPDSEAVLADAAERLVEVAKTESQAPTGPVDGIATLLLDDHKTDPLTGALNMKGFEDALSGGWTAMDSGGEPLTVLVVGVDAYQSFATTLDVLDRDTIAVGVASHLRKHFDAFGGIVARLDESRFAVLMQGIEQHPAIRAADDFRADVERGSPTWAAKTPEAGLCVSVGVVTAERGGPIGTQRDALAGALRGLVASQTAGGNCVRAFVPKAAA